MIINRLLSLVFLFAICLSGCENARFETIKHVQKSEFVSKVNQPNQFYDVESEAKAVKLAEEFIKINGYTSEPADKENLSHETVEFYDSITELLMQRRDSIEPNAYGVLPHGKGNIKGWTVIFRYNKMNVSEQDYNSHGRAVTMDENFENLIVEHKDFVLENVKKLVDISKGK